MFLILMISLAVLTVGATLLLDNIPGNDDIGEFFVGAGTIGALIISGIMLWSTV